jgi:hypothetical protein
MSALLAEAIKELGLVPGQSYRTEVNGHEFEIRMLDTPRPPEPAGTTEPPEERSELEETDMVSLWLEVPPSPRACVVHTLHAEPILPSPIVITEADLAPE